MLPKIQISKQPDLCPPHSYRLKLGATWGVAAQCLVVTQAGRLGVPFSDRKFQAFAI